MMRSIFLLIISFILFEIVTGQSKVCSKIDFNRAAVNEFRECYQQFLPVLKTHKYSEQTAVTPYRWGTEFFLSPTVEGSSCLESVPVFKLDENSVIQAAIHLSFVDEGAFISIVVVDLIANNEAYTWKYQKSHKWFMVEEKITKKVPQAMIEIRTNMNKKSILALEYINVVNTNVQTPECTKDVPPPSPPTTVATTLPPSTTASATTPEDWWSTTEEPFHPADDEGSSESFSISPKSVSWLVLGGSISLIVLAIIFALIFIFIIRPRYRARILHVTMPNNNTNTITMDEKNDAYVQTLPRLHVHHDPITGPYISGVTSIKHLEETDAK